MVHEEYYKCYYNNDPLQHIRSDIYDKWEPHFINLRRGRQVLSLKQETLLSCSLMYDAFSSYTPKLNVFFSGGMDSECLLRCFHQSKFPVTPIIIRHVHAQRAEETVNALKVCEELNLHPTIFNLNLPRLCASGKLHDLGLKYQTARLGQLELIYVLDLLQEPSILADDIQLVYMSPPEGLLTRNETEYQQWLYEVREDEDGLYNRYEHLSGIPTIADSFRYTPHNWAALILAPHIKDIVLNNKGKASSLSTKNFMMSKEFAVPFRKKTNVFGSGHHYRIAQSLQEDLEERLFPFNTTRIPYLKLLEILGISI